MILLAPTKPFEHHHHAEDDYEDDDDDDDQEEDEDDQDQDDRMSSRVKLCSKIYWLCGVGSWLRFPEHIPDQIFDGERYSRKIYRMECLYSLEVPRNILYLHLQKYHAENAEINNIL